MKHLKRMFASGFLGVLVTGIAAAAPTYTVTPLGGLPGGNGLSVPEAINSVGHVVGIAGHDPSDIGTLSRAFLWRPNTGMENLGTLPGGTVSHALGINNADDVVGFSTTAGGTRAFLWTRSGGMEDLGDLPGGADYSAAYGINNLGQVVGASDGATGRHAFLWTREGGMQDLGDLPGGEDDSTAFAIDDSSRIVGYGSALSPAIPGVLNGPLSSTSHAVIWTAANGIQDLEPYSRARGLSGSIIVGSLSRGDGIRRVRGAIAWREGIFDRLPDLPALSDDVAVAVNASGQIVGFGYSIPVGTVTRAGLWTDEGAYGLAQLIDAADPQFGNLTLSRATGINDVGQIVSHGFSSLTASIGYLLSPVSSGFTLTAPATVGPGQNFSVNWQVPASRAGHEFDWIGFFNPGAANWDADPVRWTYTAGITAGSLLVTAPTTPGQYEFRYLLDGGYDTVAATFTITVAESGGDPGTPSAVVLSSPATAVTGQWLALQWNAPDRAGHAYDWIGFYHAGDADFNADPARWTYTHGNTTGELWIQAPSPGQYEFRYLTDGEYHSIASSQLTVTP